MRRTRQGISDDELGHGELAVSNIVGNISTQYILRYKPDIDPATADRVYRKIKVDIPTLPNAKVYAKDGYFPTPLSGAPTP